MKFKSWLFIGVAALSLATATTVTAQTNAPMPSTDTAQNNFVATAGSWFTSIDETKSFPTNGIDIGVGALWENNVSWAQYLNVSKSFGSIEPQAEMANAGVLGTIERGQAGLGYDVFKRGDLKLVASVNGGYQRQTLESQAIGHGIYVQPELAAKKIMAHGAFAEISLRYDFYLKGQQPAFPILGVGTGFTF